MPSLATLPVPLLLELASHLSPPRDRFAFPLTRFTDARYTPLARPAADLLALSGVCRRLREVLRERVFGALWVGELTEGIECTRAYQDRVRWLASEGGVQVLGCVRALWIAPLLPEGIEALAQCLERMPNLHQIVYTSSLPFPPLFVPPLLALEAFTSLHFEAGSVESLPHVLPLAHKLADLSLETLTTYPLPAASLALCPVTVAPDRRRLVPWGKQNLATRDEQCEASVRGLGAYLERANETLEMLVVDGTLVSPHCDSAEWISSPPSTRWFDRVFRPLVMNPEKTTRLFPRLERLALHYASVKSEVMDSLLDKVAERIRWLHIDGFERGYPKPPTAFPRLEFFRTIFADKVSVAAFVSKVVASPRLEYLTLNGLIPREIPEIFDSSIACRETLRELVLQTLQTASLQVGQLRLIALSCPNLELLDLKATWGGEVIDFLDALSSLAKLRTFSFDHPWEVPSGPRLPWADGRTIRSDRNGDFRVISCFGTSVEHEMRRRILDDIDAVRPTYTTRFLSFAADHPHLTLLVWHATEVVDWSWRFKRIGTGGTVEVEADEAYVPYKEDPPKGEGDEEEEERQGERERQPVGVYARFPLV